MYIVRSELTEAEQYVCNKLAIVGIDPLKTELHFKLKKRKEMSMSTKRKKTVKGYVAHLRKARDKLEEKLDDMNNSPATVTRLEAEAVTLTVVINDLETLDVKEFSYWDVN